MDVVTGILLPLIGGLLVIAAIIAANGYFVAQEFSYMAVDRSGLRARAEGGDEAARRTLRITERTSFMLSGAQLGITVTGLLVGYVAQPLVGTAIGRILGGVGVPDALGVTIGTVGILVLATFVQMLFGELFPKNLAIARPYDVAARLSRSTAVYMRVMGWAIRFFDASSNALLKVLRIEPVHDVEHSANVHDLQRIVTISQETGDLPEELGLVLDRMLDFPQRHVAHAIVPRSRVAVVQHDEPVSQVLTRMEGGHSRYPVLDGDGDVVGVVHVAEVLRAHREGQAGREVREIARPPTVVPTLMTLPRALEEMSGSSDQLCCVIDEWGGFVGIVTVEDLVEEVVGEITDEHDVDEEPHLVPGDTAGRWSVRGDAPLDEVEREIGVTLPRGDAQTVAGMAIAARGALPDVDEAVDVRLPPDPVELAHDDAPPERVLRLTVLERARHVPTWLRLELVGPEGLDAGDLDGPVDPVVADPAEVS
ncbi:hemolysin family protein [Phycicoccus flavus]|uniref:hemolysin family protein n=1 Tax=Phycicoccus flavus TaxID=2502783 RepID=UPI000FEBB0D0|nr:hemolysin family protein [Phycicoccus flavus]NHA67607.1 HlyC/CorC family transporter [Phycicoccus flavus]